MALPPVGGPGDTCQDAGTAITTNTLLTAQSTFGYFNNYGDAGTGCGYPRTPGPDRTYEVLVPAGQRLTATALPDAGFDIGVDLIAGPAAQCDVFPRQCVGGADNDGAGDPEVAQYLNSTAAAQSVFVIIDSYATASSTEGAGSYDLNLVLAAPPAGDTCATATALVAGTALTGETFNNFGNDYTNTGASNCGVPNTGSDRVYSISVGAGQRLTTTVTPSTTLNTSVSLVSTAANCATRTCVANGSGGAAGVADVAQYVNTTAAAQTLLVVVDSLTLNQAGTFSILAALDTPPASGDVCQTPDVLATTGTAVAGTTVGFTNNYAGAGMGCSGSSAGPDHVYSLDIPAGMQATVTVTPPAADAGMGLFDPSVSVVASPAATCDAFPRACVASINSAGIGLPEVIRRLNPTAATQTVFVMVDSTAAAGGTYTIAATLATPPAGEVCQSAGTAVTATTLLSAQTTIGYADNYTNAGNGCGYNLMPGPDRTYQVTLPAGQRLTATATPDAGYDIGVDLIPGVAAECDVNPRVCAAGDDDDADGIAEVASYTNFNATPESVFVVVDSFSSGAAGVGNFDLNLVFDTPPVLPAGDVCQAAVVIAASGTLANQTTTGFLNHYEPDSANNTCSGDDNPGFDRVYSVTLNAGQTLKVDVDPAAMEDPSVYFIAGPASNCKLSPICVGGSDVVFDGVTETASYTNNTGATQTVFVVVDTFFANTAMTYSLIVSITP